MWINTNNLLKNCNTFIFIIALCTLITISLGQQWDERQNSRTIQSQNNNNIQSPQFDQNVQIIASQEKFALDLYLKSLSMVKNANVPRFNFVMAPFSVWSLLVLVTEGAGGNTYSELIRTLDIPDDLSYVHSSFQKIQSFLKINSSLTEIVSSQLFAFDRKLSIDLGFKNKLQNDYNSEIIISNFNNKRETLNSVNQYLSRISNDKIKSVLQESDLNNAQMIMISALIFNSQWKSPFNASYTKPEPFYDENGNTVGSVNMMFQRSAFPYTGMAQLNSHLLELPYANGELSMILILPIKGISLNTVITKLKNVSLKEMFNALKRAEQAFEDDEVEVHMPRFNTNSELSLQSSLEAMGISDLFQPDFADLSKITATGTFLSSLIHRVEIKVNEEGTYAAATTTGVFSNKSTPPRFYANRPFFYLIVEKQTNTLLFLENCNTFLFLLTIHSLINPSFGQASTGVQASQFDQNEQIIAGQEKFALDLYLNALNAVKNENVPRHNFIIAPFSVWSLLVLITEGAGGTTYSELIQTLGVPDNLTYVHSSFKQIQTFLRVNSSLTEIITTQLFAFDRKLRVEPEFTGKLINDYNSDIIVADFGNKRETLKIVEDHLAKKSNGKIPQILQESDLIDAQMIMVSALIFNAQWKFPFNVSNTKEEPFHDGSGNPVGTVNMMFQQSAFPYTVMQQLSSHLLELPYASGELSMIVILPIAGVPISTVVRNLKNVSLKEMFAALRKAELEFENDEVEVHLPRFTTNSELSLQGSLEAIGLNDLFQDGFSNLRKITPSGTYLSSLLHRVEIKVNEEGTYAAAITAAVFVNKIFAPKFYANRPFFYLIVEKQTNTLLFMGQYENPQVV